MEHRSVGELRDFVRKTFGRDLADSELNALSSRLMGIAPLIKRFGDWRSAIGDIEPATTFRVSLKHSDDR